MAEQVNQRLQYMINELEQMKRTNLYNDDEIKEISRKRKEFEYHIQRRVKQKDDYVQYIAYELTLLEDIAIRRKQANLTEKKKDIEYSIAKRVNKVFKQFIHRFQNDVEIYFEYIKFCKSVGFIAAVSGMIGEMLLIHGDKPKMWQLASKWECEEQNNHEAARNFLFKGIQRHPESEILYLELFKIELSLLCFSTNTDEEKEKLTKRADIVWRNGLKNTDDIHFLFKLFDLCLKYEVGSVIQDSIKEEIWSRRKIHKDVWSYVAEKVLDGCEFPIRDDDVENNSFPKVINMVLDIYEEALHQFPDPKLCTKFIHILLGVNDNICPGHQKVKAIKHAWMFGHDNGLLSDKMYYFGIEMYKLEDEMSDEGLMELLNSVIIKNPQIRPIWEEKILLNKYDEKKMLAVLQDAVKVLKSEDAIYLYDLVLDNIKSNTTLMNLYEKFQNCENVVLMCIKPKLLQKMYEHNGLKAARDLYNKLIKAPPVLLEVNQVMIDIEKEQEKPNIKYIRKYYECAVQHHGSNNVDIWMDFMKFEMEDGNASAVSLLYRRAIGMLKKELIDKFIKNQTLAKLK